ncbi:MAG: integrase catalytic domain-containing protein [Saprospiraceae bacterium]|nr:integrase catalytic domain-containing protein [Saprospiraceae bacterium]
MDKDIKIPNGKGKVKTHAVRFNLKSITDKNKTTLISAVFRYDNQKLVYSTQHKIAPKHWSLRTQLPIILYNLQKFRPGKMNFDSIDLQFQKDYIFWRYEYTKAESQNTINKDFGSIKNILKLSFKEGLHKNTIFNEDDFHVKTAKTSIFALNESEVNRLYSFDFSDNPRLERVRDWFLISCWSALRWSDFSTIKPEHILKDGEDTFLRKKNIKTGTVVFIPVDERLYLMFEKYNFKSIDISNQKFNEYIKEVFEVVGITDNIILDTNFKGKDKEVIKRKCDIVSAHDGRRTWATINYLKGYAIGLLMQVTGHTQESTFLSYVGADPLAKAKALMKQQKEFASLQKSKY